MSAAMKMRHINEDIDNKVLSSFAKKEWREIFKEDIKKHTSQGLYLKGSRLREGLTQKELGDLIGVHQNNISALENGKRPIGKNLAKKLAEVLNTDYRMFL